MSHGPVGASNAADTHTSATLLLRLQDLDDQEAWTAFVERYAPVVYSWCRRFRLQESDAADVTQEVLLKLLRHMREFRYEPGRGRFRGWLKTVTANAVRDLARGWENRLRATGDEHSRRTLLSLQDPAALESLAAGLEAQYEQELLQRASEQVRLRVQPHTWQAWEMTAIGQRTAAETAADLELSVGDVYVARSRVNRMLGEEIKRLSGQDDGAER